MNVTANCERDGKWWVISFPDLPRCYSQARRLSQVEEMARDAAGLYLDVPKETLKITVVPKLSKAEENALEEMRNAATEAAAAAARASKARTSAARQLKENGLTVRDIGELLGISFQRAQKLAA